MWTSLWTFLFIPSTYTMLVIFAETIQECQSSAKFEIFKANTTTFSAEFFRNDERNKFSTQGGNGEWNLERGWRRCRRDGFDRKLGNRVLNKMGGEIGVGCIVARQAVADAAYQRSGGDEGIVGIIHVLAVFLEAHLRCWAFINEATECRADRRSDTRRVRGRKSIGYVLGLR